MGMTLLMTIACMSPGGRSESKVDEPAAKKELFAGEDWYKGQKGKEQQYTGTLRYTAPPEVGIGRFNPYRLEMTVKGKKEVREVYAGGKPELLKPYVGRTVKLTGKPVDLEVIGHVHREIWPARLEVLRAGPRVEPEEKAGRVKILGRAAWASPATARGAQQLVLRSAKDAAAALDLPGNPAEATRRLARLFKVPAIDWTRQMVVVVTAGVKPTGGYRVEVTDLARDARTLTVRWKLHGPKPGSPVTDTITHPGTAVLVEHIAGPVRFEQEK
jgi:hypothetical protein